MDPLLILLLQIAVILAASRLVGLLFRKIHQPQVIGEMVAGLLLGPTLLGWLAPDLSSWLFPPDSLDYLYVLSQIGLILFMFLVGLELDPLLLRGRRRAALIISNASIVAPFLLGIGLAYYLYPRLSGPPVPMLGFTLFLGAAMSITAFPVLARILSERQMLHSPVGALTLACAAANDVTAWCILAVVITVVRSGQTALPFWFTVAGSALFILVLVVAARPWLNKLALHYRRLGRLSSDMMTLILLLLLAVAWITEWLGIHALFGAFVLGAVMPKDHHFVGELTGKLEGLTITFLLPLFFALAGLRASIGLIRGLEMWFYCGLILVVAIAGKFGGSTIAARLSGLSWREASALGVLMNTRGLVELVILSIGFDLGIISPTLYTMMVVMAIITTFITSPLLESIYPLRFLQRSTIWQTAPVPSPIHSALEEPYQ